MKNGALTKAFLAFAAIAVLALAGAALAQDIGLPDREALKGLYPGKTYSPYAQRSFPAGCTGARRTCTPECRSMLGCSATPLVTKKPTASLVAKKTGQRPGCRSF